MNYDKFRENLETLISRRGVSLNVFATELGMTCATISRYLNGLREPELPYVIRIAAQYNVSVDWILGLSDNSYGPLPDELQELISRYSSASQADKTIIQQILLKYKED